MPDLRRFATTRELIAFHEEQIGILARTEIAGVMCRPQRQIIAALGNVAAQSQHRLVTLLHNRVADLAALEDAVAELVRGDTGNWGNF